LINTGFATLAHKNTNVEDKKKCRREFGMPEIKLYLIYQLFIAGHDLANYLAIKNNFDFVTLCHAFARFLNFKFAGLH
jgi:hypothetical protein